MSIDPASRLYRRGYRRKCQIFHLSHFYALRFLSASCFMALMAGVATGQSVVLTDSCPTPKEGATELVCSYTVSFNGMKVGSLLDVALLIPKGVETWNSPNLDCSNGSCAVRFDGTVRRDRHVVYKLEINKPSGTVKFRSIAPKEDYASKKKPYYVEMNGQPAAPTSGGEVAVPARKKKVSLFRLAIGGGYTRLTDDFVDFKEVRDSDEHIFIDNDSRGRAEVLAGILLKLHEFESGQTLDVATNLEFVDGKANFLDGIFFGLGFGLTPAIEVVVGYSISRGKELSHGFQRAMGRFVKDRRENSEFPELQDIELEHGVIKDSKDYDGLPLFVANGMGEMEKIFPGNPITNSFNKKWSVGILIPLNLWKQIKGDD